MIAGEAEQLIPQVTAALSAQLSAWFGVGATFSTPQPKLSPRRWSVFLHYPVQRPTGAPTTILVKIPRRPEIPTLAEAIAAEKLRLACQQEYQTLAAIAATHTAHASQSCTAIRPLAYLSDCNALVMEELQATPLKSLILTPQTLLARPAHQARIETTLTRAGQWLRIFHQNLGKSRSEPHAVDHLQQDVDQALQRLSALLPAQTTLAPLQAALNTTLHTLQSVPLPVALLHGDFNCANILVAPDGRVAVLDNNTDLSGVIYHDLAKLLCDLATRKVQVLSQGLFLRPAHLARYRQALLTGYFGADAYQAQALDLALAVAILRKWTQDEQLLASMTGAKRLAAATLTPLLRRYFQQLVWSHLQPATPVGYQPTPPDRVRLPS
jgi:hypothetical protein